MGRKFKPRLIPEQDRRICVPICVCQLTIVLSCVAIAYLSVAIYIPSYKVFKSGYETNPVMCQTVNTFLAGNCTWASCAEWCLTKSGGPCPQMNATVRRNGTEVIFENCTKLINTDCPEIKLNQLTRYNCNNDTECENLKGVYNCTHGHCWHMSKLYLCHHPKPDAQTLDIKTDNRKLNGFFECYATKCHKIKKFYCVRYCSNITTNSNNIYLLQDNSVWTGRCENVYAYNEARGPNPGVKLIERKKIWDDSQNILLTSCFEVFKEGETRLRATDCVNGTTVTKETLPIKEMNFTTFWKIYENSTDVLDPTERFLPHQSILTIYNSSRLYINVDRCVNTLRDECQDFFLRHGSDGDNNTAQSRYRCFYNKNDSNVVLIQYDLEKTYIELLVATILPSVLFIISFTTLCIITRSIKVGDDAKMRCKYCRGNNSDQEDGLIMTSKNKNDDDTNVDSKNLQLPMEPDPNDNNAGEIIEVSPMALSPCTESTDRSFSQSITSDRKINNEERPLVIL